MYVVAVAPVWAYSAIYGADFMLQIIVASCVALSYLPRCAASDALVHASSHLSYSCADNGYIGCVLGSDCGEEFQ